MIKPVECLIDALLLVNFGLIELGYGGPELFRFQTLQLEADHYHRVVVQRVRGHVQDVHDAIQDVVGGEQVLAQAGIDELLDSVPEEPFGKKFQLETSGDDIGFAPEW